MVVFSALGGSHRRAVHQHATIPLRPWLAAIGLSLAFVGLATKAVIPDLVYDELAYLVSADPGSATTGDGDDDSKLVPHNGSTMCKCGDFAMAILDTVELVLPQSLMPVHALAVTDAATEPLLPDHFLPNAETGTPACITLGATTASPAVWLLGTVGATPLLAACHRSDPVNLTAASPAQFYLNHHRLRVNAVHARPSISSEVTNQT